jgi:hypothetical protein
MGAPKSATSRAEALAKADLLARRQEYVWAAPDWLGASRLASWALEDPRDAPAMWLVLNVAALALPAACALHVHPAPPHWAGAAYMLVNYAVFLQVGAAQQGPPTGPGAARARGRGSGAAGGRG